MSNRVYEIARELDLESKEVISRLREAVTRLCAGLAAEVDPLRRAALLLQLSNVYRTDWELTESIEAVRQGAWGMNALRGGRVPEMTPSP